MVVNFFITNNNIQNIFFNIKFTDQQSDILNSIINISSILSIILLFSSVFLIVIFLYKLFKAVIIYNDEISKIQIFEVLKEFFKVLFLTFTFILTFGVLFFIFDSLFLLFNKLCNFILDNVSNGEDGGTIENISSILYWIITGVEQNVDNNPNFLYPQNYLETANGMNFLISIIFIISFSFFLIWMVWMVFQKMLEIIFLYITFPISLSIGMEIQQINWRIWLKEIFNKMILIFVFTLFIRVFLYLFYLIHSNLIMEFWKNDDHNEILYLDLFVVLALSSSMMFAIKIFSFKSRENIGVISSFKQTKNFIANNYYQNSAKNIKLVPINSNINNLRKEIINLSNNQINYSNLKKVKVFNK